MVIFFYLFHTDGLGKLVTRYDGVYHGTFYRRNFLRINKDGYNSLLSPNGKSRGFIVPTGI